MQHSHKLLLLGLILGIFLILPRSVSAATFTVTNTTDNNDTSAGDGVCTTGVAGQCSLKAAIQEANALAGADTINFNIPTTDSGYRDYNDPNTASSGDSIGGDDYWTIRTTAGLPNITSQITIDGSTQTTNQGDTNIYGPEIELKGPNSTGAQSGPNGLYFYTGSDNSSVKGLVVNAFNNGIYIHIVSNITITGCYVGTDVKGAAASANYNGIQFRDSVQNVTIGGTSPGDGNLLSGNAYQGVGSGVGSGAAGSGNIYVLGNYIGTDRTGMSAIPNAHHGIQMARQAYNVHIGDGTSAGRNIISGNIDENILIRHESHDIDVRGNYIGLGVDGLTYLSNTSYGVWFFEAVNNITIGGSNLGDRNYIAGAKTATVLINADYGAYNNKFINNYIGTDINGNIKENLVYSALGKTYGTAVVILGGDGGGTLGHDNVIGQAGLGNLIKGPYGVWLRYASTSTVEDNTISDCLYSGVAFMTTENEVYGGAPGDGPDATDGTLINNFIGSSASQPGGVDPNFGLVVGANLNGVEIDGSSPTVTGNTIVGNTEFGIMSQVWGIYIVSLPAFFDYRSNEANIYFSRPIIGSTGHENLISGNGWGGIFLNASI